MLGNNKVEQTRIERSEIRNSNIVRFAWQIQKSQSKIIFDIDINQMQKSQYKSNAKESIQDHLGQWYQFGFIAFNFVFVLGKFQWTNLLLLFLDSFRNGYLFRAIVFCSCFAPFLIIKALLAVLLLANTWDPTRSITTEAAQKGREEEKGSGQLLSKLLLPYILWEGTKNNTMRNDEKTFNHK